MQMSKVFAMYMYARKHQSQLPDILLHGTIHFWVHFISFMFDIQKSEKSS